MSRPAKQPSGAAKAIAAAALALAALLVLVALASRGHLGADPETGGRDRLSLPPGAFGWLYAALLIAGVVGLPFFFYIYARETPYSRSRRRKARLAPFVVVAVFGIALFVATHWSAEVRDLVGHLQGLSRNIRNGDASARAAQPPAPEWAPLVVLASIAAAGLGGLVTWRWAKRRRDTGADSLAGTLSDALGATLGDLRAEQDPRRAIILAYAHMEQALDRSGVPRHEAEAPLEYLSRVLLELHVSPGPVFALTELFERAKFSHHPLDGEMKEKAITALEEIRDELRALA
jgi:Domain of unknown function (DUF4129)